MWPVGFSAVVFSDATDSPFAQPNSKQIQESMFNIFRGSIDPRIADLVFELTPKGWQK